MSSASDLNFHGITLGLRVHFDDSKPPIVLDQQMVDASERANTAALPALPPTPHGAFLSPLSLHSATPLSADRVTITHSHHFDFPNPRTINPQPVEREMEDEMVEELVNGLKRKLEIGTPAASPSSHDLT